MGTHSREGGETETEKQRMASYDEAFDYFYVLPEGCIANIISFTSPPDACRMSLVSPVFRSAAGSDAVWERFLPPEYCSIISRSVSPPLPLSFPCKKDLYLSLCDSPLLIDGGSKSFSLDKRSGKKCYMISARDLLIIWGDTPRYWRWIRIPLPEARFPEVAELISVCWLEIRGKIDIRMLSPMTLYTAYLVFKSTTAAYGFEYQPVETTVGLVGGESLKRTVYLDTERGRRQRNQIVPSRPDRYYRSQILETQTSVPEENVSGPYPQVRGDGWLEIELGDFFYGGDGEDGELEMSALEVTGGGWKGGLIFQGIDIRPKVLN